MKRICLIFSVFLLAMGPRRPVEPVQTPPVSKPTLTPTPVTPPTQVPTPSPRTPTPTPSPSPLVGPTAPTCNSTAAGGSVCCYCAFDSKSMSTCASIGDRETCNSDENRHSHDCVWDNDHCKSRFNDRCHQWVNQAGCGFVHIEAIESGSMTAVSERIKWQENGGFPEHAVCGQALFAWVGHSSPGDAGFFGLAGVQLAAKTNACQTTAISDGCATFGPRCDKATGDRLMSAMKGVSHPFPPPGSSISFIGSQLIKNKSQLVDVQWAEWEGAACSYIINASSQSPSGISPWYGPYPHSCTFGAACYPEEDGHTVSCATGGVANGTSTSETCCCASEACRLVQGSRCR